MAIAGAAVRWLRDNLGLIKSAGDIGKYLIPILFYLSILSC